MNAAENFFAPNKTVRWLALLIVFGLGLAIRLYDLTDAPLDFHATRQLHSALMARGMFYQRLENVPEWKREIAVQQWKAEGLIEPPFMEWITAQTYRLIGGDFLWVARLYAIFFWMLGGAALYLLARELAGLDGAIIAVIYYLFLPYAAIASRAFQPDPLMTALIVFAYWSMVRWLRQPTWDRLITVGVFGGLAILSKSVAVFFIAPSWAAVILANRGLRKAVHDPQIWALGVLTVVPYAIFHVYGVFITGLLTSQFSLRFFPNLWLDPIFYLRWNGELSSVLGFEWFLAAIVCTLVIRDKLHRVLVNAMWVGYFAYGLTFPHHIATHDYYHLPMIPVVGLCLGVGAEKLFRSMRGPKWAQSLVVLGVVVYAATIKAWDVRVTLKRDTYSSEIAYWQRMGERIGPGASVIGLTQDYGYRLAYWGWVTPANWMTTADFSYRELAGHKLDDIQALFDAEIEGKDYFVVTMFHELERQPELKQILTTNYPIVDEGSDYVIFDLRRKLEPTEAGEESP
ncbi:MAG: glycosyltransferase family 39 protein [Anaerolineaceae bacterium]|nr:glycosyltransferase family 39 protein [Anaerolineaceae bacterium]